MMSSRIGGQPLQQTGASSTLDRCPELAEREVPTREPMSFLQVMACGT
jgi:hypothetical protein